MKKISVVLTLCFSAAFAVLGQETRGVCGTTIADQDQYTNRLDANIQKVESGQFVAERGAVQYVPVHFHLVGDADGNGKVKERLVLDQMCRLNEFYAPMEMRFYLRAHPTNGLFNYSINANNVYSSQSSQSGTFTMQSKKHPNALNVYVVDGIDNSGGSGTVLAYYNTTYDWVVSRKNQINGKANNNTLAHELGHFFSLRHTFYGWEQDGQDPNEPSGFESGDPGWPVAPVIAPYGGNIPTERQDGSNCAAAADKICDTPPDYNFGSLQQDCELYTGGAKDPAGVLVDPMEHNIMSYFFVCTNYTFTPMQNSLILADRESSQRNYLDNNYTPVTLNINTPTDLLVGPIGGDTTDYHDEVLLEWKSVADASHYLVELDITNAFGSPLYQGYIVTGTSKMLTDLQKNRLYYWRVRPFNDYVTCADDRQSTFRTSFTSGTADIKALSGLQIAPNPVAGAASARLFVNATEDFEAVVNIFDATGRRIKTLASTIFPAGENTIELPVEGLSTGLYFVTLENADGRAVRKMSIVR